MKILQINKFFFLKGGSERYFFDLSELLSQKGHGISILSTNHPNNFPYFEKDDFVEYNDFSKTEGIWKDSKKIIRIFWNREAAKKLEKLIKKEKPDIAHLHNIFSHLSPSIIYTLKKHNIPIVMTLHDYKMFCPNYKFFSQGKPCFDCIKRNNFRSCLNKRCIKNSWSKSLIGYLEGKWQKDFLKIIDKIDIFLAPSLFIKRKAISAGLPAKKIIHLPNFIDNEFLNNKKIKNEFNPQKYILYFGRLSEEKGIDLLIKSYLENSVKLSKWIIKIAGEGPEQDRLKKLNKRYKQIEFLGKKKIEELKKIISQSYLIIVPSIWPENFPYSILEGMGLGKVVLSARIGGMSEMIEHKETGLLFNPGDIIDLTKKINWAIDNPKKIKEIGIKAQKEILNKYNSEKHYNKLIKIYEQIKNN